MLAKLRTSSWRSTLGQVVSPSGNAIFLPRSFQSGTILESFVECASHDFLQFYVCRTAVCLSPCLFCPGRDKNIMSGFLQLETVVVYIQFCLNNDVRAYIESLILNGHLPNDKCLTGMTERLFRRAKIHRRASLWFSGQ